MVLRTECGTQNPGQMVCWAKLHMRLRGVVGLTGTLCRRRVCQGCREIQHAPEQRELDRAVIVSNLPLTAPQPQFSAEPHIPNKSMTWRGAKLSCTRRNRQNYEP